MCDFHRSLDRALEPHTDPTVRRHWPAASLPPVPEVDPHTDWGLEPDWYERIDPMGTE